MMPAKYYIYAGGRWCEVDTARGRVAGFRYRARFCYLRAGKLEVGRSVAVLRALRALASGAGGAARDSAPLLGRRPHRSRRESVRAHRCCSQHLHHSRCDLNANELSEKPSITAPERKRKRSTSEETRETTQAKKNKTEQTLKEKQCQTSPQTTKLKGRKEDIQSLVTSSEDGSEQKKHSPQKKIGVTIRRNEEEKLVHSLLQSSSDDNSQEKKRPSSQRPKPGPRVQGKEKLVQNLQSSENNGKKQKKQSPQKKPGPRVREKDVQSSSNSEKNEKSQKKKSPQKKLVRSKDEEKLVKSLLDGSSSEDNEKVSSVSHPKPVAKSKKNTNTESSSSESSVQRQACKELVIDDGDVRVLRGFLARGAGREELDRFDNDEDYKARVFYKLNPLVVLKRCGPLEQLLLQRLSLKEFARHLGLRSVADVTPEKRYRMRHSTRQARNTTSVTSDSENEKANTAQPKRRQLWNRDKEMFNSFRSSRSSELKVKPQIHRPQDSSQDSDSDSEVKKHIKKHLERRASARINPRREEKESKKNKNKEDSDSIAVDESSTDGTNNDKTSSDTDENPAKSRRRTRGMKERMESVVISDETDSEVRNNRRKSRNRARKEEHRSVAKSDESHSDVDSGESKPKTSAKTKSKDDSESVIISDDSDSNTDENMDGNLKSTRRTRSQGPEKRVLREQNKSVLISDDSDSNSHKNRGRSRTKAKEPDTAKAQSKNVVSNDNNEGGKETRRTRSRGPDRALKEHNRTTDKVTKDTDKQARKEDDSTVTKKITRSSIKGADDSKSLKDKNTTEATKKDQKQTSNKTENTAKSKDKVGPGREAKKDHEISIISDSDDAFETPKISPKKTNSKDFAKQLYAANMARNDKGRFLKRNTINESGLNDKKSEKEKQKENSKTNDREKQLNDKNKSDKHRAGEKDREKSKVPDKDKRNNKDNKENSRGENKSKENNRKAAVARSMFIKPVKFKKSSVANGREYTSLEDHAIVAWVSVGNRERMVNGNAIWRELERDYERLTSQKRSWHSLRNRYLRYVLPALGALALPPAQASRLRAAAAQGKLKSRNGSRRNSIFSAPRVRSAAGAARLRLRPGSGPGSGSGSGSDAQSDDNKERTASHRARPPAAPSRPAQPASPPKPPATPARAAPPSPPSPPRSARLRARPSAAASPMPKKKRIHHL